MTAPVIRSVGLEKRYGKTAVLRGVDLELAAGEFLGLAGVNGAGKTTLLKCMLDFCAVDAGTIELFGIRHTEPRSRARLAFLPERFVPPYYLTGRDFLAFMLRLQQRPYAEAEVLAMLEALDLDAGALARPVRAYSKGMTQKLGLAACFLSRRDLYVLDEPMSGLDPKARACVKALLGRLRAEGRTLFFTSHALADIEEICDRMVVLHQGVPYFSGAPRSLCEHYGENSTERAFLRCIGTSAHV
jgi:ABC-2 type transport system ATP-binding protein